MDDKEKPANGAEPDNQTAPIPFSVKKAERSITRIGAQIADANDISEEIDELNEEQGQKLETAQRELEELYVALGEEDAMEQNAQAFEKASNGK